MAASLARFRNFISLKSSPITSVSLRAISCSAVQNDSSNESWLSKLLVRRIEPTKESHSRMLSDKEVIYELITHNVKPQANSEYLENYQKAVQLVHARPELHCELVASWKVSVGDQDQSLHLWKYTGGFASIDNARKQLWQDKEFCELEKVRGKLLRSRKLQYLLAFSYWPAMEPRSGSNLYEIRSYILKPGTMIEWGNNWARAINYRRNNDEAFAGFFSQIGRLYNVHHIWCYPDLQVRKDTRESAWRMPGWDECVAYTVPLIREMDSRILHPTSFSPTQ